MKSSKWAIALLVLALAAGSGSAWADYGRYNHGRHHHGHNRGDVYLGLAVGSVLGAWWYAMPRHNYQTVVVERETAPVYIERPIAPPPPAAYWYYCEAARGYYPYIAQCPGGWMRVVPQTPGQP